MPLINGTTDGDILAGTAGNDTILGLAGFDIINASTGSDSIDGGDGTDLMDYRAYQAQSTLPSLYWGGIQVNFTTGLVIKPRDPTDTVTGSQIDTITGIEELSGTDFADTIVAGPGIAVLVEPGYGNDTLIGGGDQALIAYLGDKPANMAVTVNLAAATPIATYAGSSEVDQIFVRAVRTGAGNDTLIGAGVGELFMPGEGSNSVDGGAGTDTVRYDSLIDALNLDLRLSTGQAKHGTAADTLAGIEIYAATYLNDTLQGSAGNEIFQPLNGNDTIIGGGGTDWVSYAWTGIGTPQHGAVVDLGAGTAADPWDGADSLSGLSGAEGSSFADTLTGLGGTETGFLRGLAGADRLVGAGGQAMTIADYSQDPGAVTANLATGTATDGWGATDALVRLRGLIGSAGADVLTGEGTANRLTGGAGADTIAGAAGDDTLDGGTGVDWLTGGTGNDSYLVDAQGDLIFENAGEGLDSVTTTVSYYLYANIETLTLTGTARFGVGNEEANTLTGNNLPNTLIGWAGNDTISGASAADTIYGVDANDSLSGDDGNDYLFGGDGGDTLAGGNGTDALYGEAGEDSIDGGAGLDTLVGGAGGDSLAGGADPDEIYGEDGNDSLTGGADFAFDLVVGGAGDDTIDGASGLGDFDYLYGGDGNDSFRVDTPADLVFEFANGGTDTVFADIQGAGYYLYANIENLVLGGVTPFGVGNALNNALTGSAATNWLLGGAGDDTLDGQGGNDVLFGESGADRFIIGAGQGSDVIGDFTVGLDTLRLVGFGFADFAAVQATMREVAGTTAIDLPGGEVLIIVGVGKAAFSAADFLLA